MSTKERLRREQLQTSKRERSPCYQFPLREDVTITLSDIPRDLRATEVDLVARFLKALCQDEKQASRPNKRT